MTGYEYDENLPYVLVGSSDGAMYARFRGKGFAEEYVEDYPGLRIIDTTPKPRVPEDAKYITWLDLDVFLRRVARYWGGQSRKWAEIGSFIALRLEDLPGVTPDTVFTVLDERKSDD